MNATYKVKVNEFTEFSVTKKDIEGLDSISNALEYHVLQNNMSYHAKINKKNLNTKEYEVMVNGNKYTVKIQNELDLLISEMGFTSGKSKQVNEIKAPMPGLILDIPIKVGQKVVENDVLLILEAMKMENSISSPRKGVIKSINIQKGDAVDKGALLITFE